MKFRPVGAQLFHVGRRTDRHDEGRKRQNKTKKTPPAYKRVFCHLTICLPISTPTQKLPSLFLLEKKFFFH